MGRGKRKCLCVLTATATVRYSSQCDSKVLISVAYDTGQMISISSITRLIQRDGLVISIGSSLPLVLYRYLLVLVLFFNGTL